MDSPRYLDAEEGGSELQEDAQAFHWKHAVVDERNGTWVLPPLAIVAASLPEGGLHTQQIVAEAGRGRKFRDVLTRSALFRMFRPFSELDVPIHTQTAYQVLVSASTAVALKGCISLAICRILSRINLTPASRRCDPSFPILVRGRQGILP